MRTLLLFIIGFSALSIMRLIRILTICRRHGHSKTRKYAAISPEVWLDYCERCGEYLDSSIAQHGEK